MSAATASASPGASKKSPLLLEAMSCDRARAHIRGYLRKRNRHDQWQKRFFEVVDHYFVYYKRADSPDMLCAMDLYQADPPRVLPGPPGPDGRPQNSGAFCINYDRDRTFKASSAEDAERWVGVILAVQRANPAHARAPPPEAAAAGPAADDADKAGGAARSPRGAEIESSGSATGQPKGCCAVIVAAGFALSVAPSAHLREAWCVDRMDVLAFAGSGCPSNCSNHGTCSPSGRCLCDRYFAPPHCDVDYMAAVGSWPYDLVFGIETTAMIVCAAITLWSLLRRRCCVPSSERTSMLSLCSNERELAALANLIACVVRPFWFLSFGEATTSEGVFVNNVVDAVLLRVPQCAWMTAYLFMILAWRSIVLSADNQTVSWTFRGLVAFTGIAVDAIALPLAIYSRSNVNAPEYLHSVGNGITAVAAALLFFGGLFTVWSLRRRIQLLELEMTAVHGPADGEMAPPDDAKASQVFAAIHSTFKQVMFASAIALLLIVAVAVSAAPIADPGKHPDVYFAFVVIVHCVVESFTAFQIAMLTFPRSVTATAEYEDDAEVAAARQGAYMDAGAYDGLADEGSSYITGVDGRPAPSQYAGSEAGLADLAQDSFIGSRFG